MKKCTVNRLFIVGAPKCGTTSLANWLGSHPRIFMSPMKEPHFYNTDMGNRVVTEKADYEALFADAHAEALVWAEASTWYLFSNEAVPNILTEYPEARFIAMVRDPVEMAISLYYQNRKKLHEPLTTLEEAWAAQDVRAQGKSLPRDCIEPAFLQYRKACDLNFLVERLRQRVAPEHLCIIHLENLKADVRKEYLRVLDFLDVPDDGRQRFPVMNEAAENRSYLLAHAIRTAAKLKRVLGIKLHTGVAKRMQWNRVALNSKRVSDRQRELMTNDLYDAGVPRD